MCLINNVSQSEMKQRARELAEDNFVKGLNCAESVYTALLEVGLVNFPPETVAMATGFGGGIGISGCGVCGALSAAVMTVGAVHGRHKPAQGTPAEIRDRLFGNPGLYRFFNLLAHKFEDRFGSTLCVELIKNYPGFFVEERSLKCKNIVTDTTEMAVEMIYLGANEGSSQPFGYNIAGLL